MMKATILFLLCLASTTQALDLNQLVAQLKEEEGFRSLPYQDTLGYWTIGYGHRCSQNASKISKEAAENMLLLDINKAKKEVTKYSDNEEVQFILTDMSFQMGAEGVAKFKDMLADIKKKDYKSAAEDMLDSNWHKETKKRCEKLAKMMANIKP